MADPLIKYDEPSDTLYISFVPGESATGIELNENILLRVNKRERRAVGLTLFNFSVLAQRTEMGPRSFPLPGLAALPEEVRDLALSLLLHAPLKDFLVLSAYTSAGTESIPIIYLRPETLASQAA